MAGPSAPTNLTVSGYTLNFNAATPGEYPISGYRIYTASTGGSWVGGDGTSAPPIDLTGNFIPDAGTYWLTAYDNQVPPNFSPRVSFYYIGNNAINNGGGDPICFLGSAPILTPSGYRRMDSLRAGDLIQTADGRSVAIQRVKTMVAQPGPAADPFIIPAGRFGATAALPISPRHRVAVPGRGLVEAREIGGLARLPMRAAWTYYNIGLPNWETDNLIVGGVEVESLAP